MSVLLVATPGGHLAQLVELAPRLQLGSERIWLTTDGVQARTLLAEEEVVLVPHVAERDVMGVLRSARHARALLASRQIDALVSTGAALALGYLGVAALKRMPAHYIESFTRVEAPSTTGKVLARMPGVDVYTQHHGRAGGRWRLVGSVFDGFEPVASASATPVRSAVVTVGSSRHGFRRLVERALEILGPEVTTFWQTGKTQVADLPIDAHEFVPSEDLSAAMRESDVVISHAGTGSALTALAAGKIPLLVSREASHAEVIDDHQVELGRHLEDRGLGVHRTVADLSVADLELVAARRAMRPATVAPLELSV